VEGVYLVEIERDEVIDKVYTGRGERKVFIFGGNVALSGELGNGTGYARVIFRDEETEFRAGYGVVRMEVEKDAEFSV
jgi:hypothetical protein